MSNKQKRRQLDAKRQAKAESAAQTTYEKLLAQGRIAYGTVIPEGAIAANLAEQAPNNSYMPPLYYVDQPFVCRVCGKEEVWTATQQKWYFEVAKGSIYGQAVHCRACRRKPKT